MVQPSPLQPRLRCGWKQLHPNQQCVVWSWSAYAARYKGRYFFSTPGMLFHTSSTRTLWIVDLIHQGFCCFALFYCITSWWFPSGRIWTDAQGPVYKDSGWYMVVLHVDHHLLLHCQPGCLPHGGEDGLAHWLGRRLGQANQNRVRRRERRLHHDLF